MNVYEMYGKRFSDVCTSAVVLVAIFPILVVISLVVYFLDGKPIFFTQKRVGRFGNSFKIFKFRTMNQGGVDKLGNFDIGNVSSVTRTGRILRKTKLDELPQLINVFLGDMSIVGPRPEVKKWVDVYPDQWSEVLRVRPGLTDKASIEFRDEEELLGASSDPEQLYRNEILPRKLKYGVAYVNDASLVGDVVIILQTIGSLIGQEKSSE